MDNLYLQLFTELSIFLGELKNNQNNNATRIDIDYVITRIHNMLVNTYEGD